MDGRHRRRTGVERAAPLLDTDGSPQQQDSVAPVECAAIPIHAADSELDPLASTLARPRRGGWQGSLWGTAFNMCSAILGAGALSLPHAVGAMGLIPALVLLVLTAAATHYSVVLLVSVIVATGTRSFEELARQVFGRINGRLVELSIVVFQFGTLVAYTVAIGDILQPLVRMPAIQSRLPWLTRDVSILVFWGALMLPLSMVDRMSSLQGTSLFGVLALVYLVVAVAIHFAVDASLDPSSNYRTAKLFQATEDAVSATAILMFAFTCQVNVPSLYAELCDASPSRMAAVSRRAVGLALVCYLVVGVTGYLNFPLSAQGNLLNNYCLLYPERSSASPHPPRVMLVAFGAIATTILMAYPVNVYPIRYTLDEMLFPSWGLHHRRARHISITLGVASSTLLVALVVPNISVVFSLMGGTASAYVCYITPAAAAWTMAGRSPGHPIGIAAAAGDAARVRRARAGCAALLLFGLVVGTLSTATTIAEWFQPKPPPRGACDGPGRFVSPPEAS
mmetsp:Transcript_586/g.1992  ORF Transcript_586/g.1992 Transcript_586/m.1992 type:complete len:508 (-) Transcript_586:3611-5134(-)